MDTADYDWVRLTKCRENSIVFGGMNFAGAGEEKWQKLYLIMLQKVFQEQIALEDISFQIEKGGLFCDRKSGAGKSTLLELLIKQQEEPTAGNVFVFQKLLRC